MGRDVAQAEPRRQGDYEPSSLDHAAPVMVGLGSRQGITIKRTTSRKVLARLTAPFRSGPRLAEIQHILTLVHEERRATEEWQRQSEIRLAQTLAAVEAKLDLILKERRAQETWQRQAEGTIVHWLSTIERLGHGGRATPMGGNRLLNKAIVAGQPMAFFIEADDRLLTPWFVTTGMYESEVTDFLVRELRPDSQCIDVGANFGYFTCVMAKFGGRAIGVEPDFRVFEMARDNTLINGVDAEVINAAASDTAGELTLYRRVGRSGNNSIAKPAADFAEALGEPPSEPFKATAVTIDDLASKFGGRIDFMKVDVEGAESQVLAGARETIAANPQLQIIMEWCPGQLQAAGTQPADLVKQIADLGLEICDLEPGGVRKLTAPELQTIPYRAGIVLKRK